VSAAAQCELLDSSESQEFMLTVLRRRWFDRRFQLGLPLDAFPEIIERLRGTPARLEERTRSIPPHRLIQRFGGTWSIQENVGHLLDLEPLWAGRLDDFFQDATTLRTADLNNRKTHEAGHNAQPLDALLVSFRSARMAYMTRLEGLSPSQLQRAALHPRLQQPMTVTDHCFFVAEHDDHHLARITELLKTEAAV
jgi:uncharacterized damage-inducible protein DinB